MTERFEITLSDAAQRLGMSWGRAWRLVLTGKLRGTKRDGRWVVSEQSVIRLRDTQNKNSPRSAERARSDAKRAIG